MNILAIDTATVVCSVALRQAGLVTYHESLAGKQVHIEQLALMIQKALKTGNFTETPPDALALSIGPGSFTGLRIGLATAKAYSSVKNLPLIPLPTLDAMAVQIEDALDENSASLTGILYSHRNFIHWAEYSRSKENRKWAGDYYYGTLDHFLKQFSGGQCFSPSLSQLKSILGDSAFTRSILTTRADARSVAVLAERRWEDRISDYGAIEPFYNTVFQARKWHPPTYGSNEPSGKSGH